MYHSFLIHLSADGHLGYFHVLAIINSATVNIGVHLSLSDLVWESIFYLLLVMEVFSLQKVVQILEDMVISWQEVK